MFSLYLWMVVAACSTHWLKQVDGAKILAIPLPGHSHVAESNAVAVEMVKRGHEVIFYLPDDFDQSKCAPDMPTVRYGEKFMESKLSRLENIIKRTSEGKLSMLETIRQFHNLLCTEFAKTEDSLETLRRENFDFILIDYLFFIDCIFLIPYNLSIPYVSISSAIPSLHAGLPEATSISPFILTPFMSNMPFHQRIINTLAHLLSTIPHSLFFYSYEYSKIAPGLSRQEIQKLPQKSELFIENTDVVLNYPKPLMPNVVQVGGLTIKPAKPLPKDIQQFFDQATHGVIVVSFGSTFQPSDKVKDIFLNVFKKLKQRIYWRIKDEEKRIENVLISKWLPQNDALAHKNTKLMIYHCGNNGMFESLYHGVPLLCIPQGGDQFVNSRKLEYLKIGRYFDIADLTEGLLLEAIEDILNNPIYTSNIKHLSEIYRSRPELPAERAASAIEHVMKYGGKHLRLNQVDLSPFQLLAVDVWFTIFMLLFLFIKLLLYFFTLCKTLVRSKSKIKQN